jgi:hypothetical protein
LCENKRYNVQAKGCDTAFSAVALLFVIAAPVLVAVKIVLSRHSKERARIPLGRRDIPEGVAEYRRG